MSTARHPHAQAHIDGRFPEDNEPCGLPTSRSLKSYWQLFESEHDQPHDRPLPSQVTIAVIGAGITGLSFVHHLAEQLLERQDAAKGPRQVTVALLEAREFCSGATGRNGGHLTALAAFNFGRTMEEYGLEEAHRDVRLEDRAVRNVLDLCEREAWDEEVGLVRGGNAQLYETAKEKEVYGSQLNVAAAHGCDMTGVTWLNRQEAFEKYGAEVDSAVEVPGNNIHPRKFASRLYSRCLERIASPSSPVKVDLWTKTPVTRVSKGRMARWRLTTPRGELEADYVVHATNGYASHLLPQLASGPACIVPTRAQVVAIKPAPGADPRWTRAFNAKQALDYFWQRPARMGGEIILGGGRDLAPPSFEYGIVDDGGKDDRISAHLGRFLPTEFPSIFGSQGGDVEIEWTGIMGYRRKGHPLLGHVFDGELKVEGQYISAGYTGHGAARAPACGEALAGMLLAELEGKEYELPDWLPRFFLSQPLESSTRTSAGRGCTTT